MNGLKSHVPALIAQKGWNKTIFVAHCILNGIGYDTAYRVARGDTNVKTKTLATIARILDVPSISDIIDFEDDEQQGV